MYTMKTIIINLIAVLAISSCSTYSELQPLPTRNDGHKHIMYGSTIGVAGGGNYSSSGVGKHTTYDYCTICGEVFLINE